MPDGSKNIVDTERYKYPRTATEIGGKTVHSKDNGDPVAVALRGKTPEDLVNILEENGMLDDRYRSLYKNAKAGRFRMTVGQALRYKWLRHDAVRVGGVALPAAPEKPIKERHSGKPAAGSAAAKRLEAEAAAKEEAGATEDGDPGPGEQVFDPST